MRGLLPLFGTFVLTCSAIAQGEVELEWEIRRRALDPQPALELTSESWTRRLASLEAVRRRLELGGGLRAGQAAEVRACFADESANVRARALTCASLLEPAGWDRAVLEALVRDPSPEVRAELCHAVPASVWLEHVEWIRDMAWSSEESVRRAARNVILGWGSLDASCGEVDDSVRSSGLSHQLELLGDVHSREGALGYLREVEQWLRRVRPPESFPEATEAASGFEEGEPRRAALAIWVAISPQESGEAAARTLAEGWLESLDPAELPRHRLQREWLLAAAPRHGVELSRRLARRLEDLASLGDPLERDDAREELLAGMIAAAGADQVASDLLEMGAPLPVLRDFWSLVDPAQVSFDTEVRAAWLAPSNDRELRLDVADALARAFIREPTEDTRAGLVELLKDDNQEARALAFQTLCYSSSDDVLLVEPVLFEAWQDMPNESRSAAMSWLPRGPALKSFKSALLGLGGESSEAGVSPSVLELLGFFEGDAEVGEKVEAWLLGAARKISSQGDLKPERTTRTARAAASALHSIRGEGAVPALLETLDAVTSLDTEVAKLVIAQLGKTAAGRAGLRSFFREELPTREGVEVALALGGNSGETDRKRYTDYLMRRFGNCDGVLRSRIWKVLAQVQDSDVCAFALQRFEDNELPVEQRVPALDVLVARYRSTGDTADLDSLVACVEIAPGVESRRAAIEAVGQTGASEVREFLASRLVESTSTRVVEREDLLVALARCAPASTRLWEELWRLPVAEGARQLPARFRGEKLAGVTFAFRGELEALELICGAGAWRDGEVPKLERLDGRLALALAEACREGGDSLHAHELERLALVALEGESPVQRTRYVMLGARARLWAAAQLSDDPGAVAWHAGRVLSSWVDGEIADRQLEGVFGASESELGRDPLARLRASVLQGRAVALARAGETACGRSLLDRAQLVLGASAAAHRAQEAAEAEVR